MSDKNINQMDFKELRNEVQLLRDELAIMQRKYEDILYNIDNENFSSSVIKEKNGMKTKIEINKKGIATLVEDLNNYSTITQTNNKIAMIVSKGVSAKFTSDIKPTHTNTTAEEKGMICEYNGDLYYYNNISLSWNKCPYQTEIKSLFEQTADGFNLVGDVSVCGKIIATDSSIDSGCYSQMSETGLNVYIQGSNKLGMGYASGLYNYPYITLGAGTNSTGENIGCIYKLASGIWIGDASITNTGGGYPGGENTTTDISTSYPQATGIFIDLVEEKIYRYVKGVPKDLSVAVFG